MEENIYLEFKESEKFMSDHESLEWGKVIIGMANRYGGKIIVGKKDDGSNEGFNIFEKFSEENKSGIDKLKEKIESFCQDRITPPILCDLTHQMEDDGEILIINIPRRKELPYAYRDQIKRTYYIKNSHGTVPITDDTLIAWLYNEGNFFLNKDFYSLIHFHKDTLKPVSDYHNSCMYLLPGIEIANRVLFPMYQDLNLDNRIQQEVISFLFPYLILLTLGEKISSTWRIEDHQTILGGSTTFIDEESTPIFIDKLLKENIELNYQDNKIEILKDIYEKGIMSLEKISVPIGTHFRIKHIRSGNSWSSEIVFTNPQFKYSIATSINAYSAVLDGPIYRNILKSVLNCNINDEILKDNQKFETYQFLVTTESEFMFLEHQRYEFNKMNDFIKLLNKTIQENWDYYYLIENISPVTKLYSIENKLNQVLKKLHSKE